MNSPTARSPSIKSVGRPGSSRNKPTQLIRNQLSELKQSFEGFEQQIQHTKEKKKDNDEQQVIELKVEVHSLNQTLHSETKKRDETVKALGTLFETGIKKVAKKVENPIYRKLDALIESIHDLSKKIDDVDKKFEKDRKQFPKKIDQQTSKLLEQINDFKTVFNGDLAEKDRKVRVIDKIIEEQEFNVSQLIEAERVEREQKMSAIQNGLEAESRERAKISKAMRENHQENMTHLHMRTDILQKERQEATDEIANALVHYAAALQDGVTMASES